MVLLLSSGGARLGNELDVGWVRAVRQAIANSQFANSQIINYAAIIRLVTNFVKENTRPGLLPNS